jgi:uncharacterized protein (TIGR02594 family)
MANPGLSESGWSTATTVLERGNSRVQRADVSARRRHVRSSRRIATRSQSAQWGQTSYEAYATSAPYGWAQPQQQRRSKRRSVRAAQVAPAVNQMGIQPQLHSADGGSPGFSSYASDEAPRTARQTSRRARHKRARPAEAHPYASAGGSAVIAEARRWLGTNPTGKRSLWCAHFMNFVLERSGHRGSGSGLARSFASYGRRISGPQVGAIAVMTRGRGGGHVGVVTGIDPSGNPVIISGNHNKTVAEAVYPRRRIYAYVMP